MNNQNLISAIKQLKEVRPSTEWRRSVRNELLSMAVSRDMAAKKTSPSFDWQFVFGRSLRPAFSFGALVLILVVALGAAVLVSVPKNGGNVAYNSPAPQISKVESASVGNVEPVVSSSVAVEATVVEKNPGDETGDALQYDYKIEKQVNEESAVTELVSNNEIINEIIKKNLQYNQIEKLEDDFKADFKVGLAKERGYNDKVLGGFLMAGDESK